MSVLQPRGVDISSHQYDFASVNWGLVPRDIAYVYVKTTESLTYMNPYVRDSAGGAVRAGKFVGPYHFANFREDPVKQADYFVSSFRFLGNISDILPPMLDVEEQSFPAGARPSSLDVVAWIGAFGQHCKNIVGVYPVIYTSTNFWVRFTANTSAFSNYPLFLAYWPYDESAREPSVKLPGGWRDWTYWQYASDGKIPGFVGDIDLNRFNPRQGSLAKQLIANPAVRSNDQGLF